MFERIPKKVKNIVPIGIRIFIGKLFDYGILFDGWGMKTSTLPPWKECVKENVFLDTQNKLLRTFEMSNNGGIISLADSGKLLWRHWIVTYCIRHMIEYISEDLETVECGSCDGLTAFFALSELKRLGKKNTMHLYDAWEPMKDKYLIGAEKKLTGSYSDISIDRIKHNLSEFNNVVYHKGYIPESITKESIPNKISYLSIDLNSAIPTISALEHFYPILERNGIILFDDYGWEDYIETRKAINIFFNDKSGILMPLPTGQAIYFNVCVDVLHDK